MTSELPPEESSGRAADPKHVLVTGAFGHLGSHLVPRLLKRGYRVSVIARRRIRPLQPVENLVVLDLAEQWSFDQLPRAVDTVVHLAQSPRFRDFPKGTIDMFQVNVAATAKLLDYCYQVGASHFIFTSTGGVYMPAEGLLDEKSPIRGPEQIGPYFGSKISGEILVHSYREYMNTTVFRPFFIYGPGMASHMHLARAFNLLNNKQPIHLEGESGIRINPIHVDDAAEAIVEAVANPLNETVNLAGPAYHSFREICDEFGRYLRQHVQYEISESPPNNLTADISLLKSTLYEPKRRLFKRIADFEIQS